MSNTSPEALRRQAAHRPSSATGRAAWALRIIGAGLLLLLSAPSLTFAQPAPDQPDQLVRAVADNVLRIVRDDSGPRREDRAEFERLIEHEVAPHFDFRRMTRLALGRSWQRATAAQRELLVARFTSLLIRSYAAAFADAPQGIVLTVEPVRLQPGDTDVQVRSHIAIPGEPSPLEVDYSMYWSGSTWKVYDLSVDGVDLVATYRTTFAEEVTAGGIDGLLKALRSKAVASQHS